MVTLATCSGGWNYGLYRKQIPGVRREHQRSGASNQEADHYPRNSSAAINDIEVVGSLIYLAEDTLNDGSIEILDLSAPASAPNNWFSERTMSDQALGIQLVGQRRISPPEKAACKFCAFTRSSSPPLV